VWLEIEPQSAEALLGMEVGHELVDVLKRGIRAAMGAVPSPAVFYTRSPARPNPLALHPVTVREIAARC